MEAKWWDVVLYHGQRSLGSLRCGVKFTTYAETGSVTQVASSAWKGARWNSRLLKELKVPAVSTLHSHFTDLLFDDHWKESKGNLQVNTLSCCLAPFPPTFPGTLSAGICWPCWRVAWASTAHHSYDIFFFKSGWWLMGGGEAVVVVQSGPSRLSSPHKFKVKPP